MTTHEIRGSINAGTKGLVDMWAKASEDERTLLGEMHVHYEGEIRRMLDAHPHEAYNVAHSLHGEIDASVAQTLATENGQRVRCRRGCAACCHLHVSVTDAEAQLLLAGIENEGLRVNWDKARRQASRRLADWGEQPLQERRCIFLAHDDSCSAYEYRPAACRKYLVMSDPRRCDTARYPGGEVAVVAPVVGEVVHSAMLGAMKAGSLPRMLLQAKEDLNHA